MFDNSVHHGPLTPESFERCPLDPVCLERFTCRKRREIIETVKGQSPLPLEKTMNRHLKMFTVAFFVATKSDIQHYIAFTELAENAKRLTVEHLVQQGHDTIDIISIVDENGRFYQVGALDEAV